MNMKFTKNMFLVLTFALTMLPVMAIDQKVKDAAVAVAQHFKALADASKDAKAIEAATKGLQSAQAGDLQIPKPARSPKPDEQKAIDSSMKNYEAALIAFADALKASNANKADAGLKSKVDQAQSALTASEQVLGATISAIK